MEKLIRSFAVFLLMLCLLKDTLGCIGAGWNMTMEQLLMKSDIVVYGKDIDHGKFRLPTFIDARFDVYCVFKKGDFRVPRQVIIEDIYGGDCSGVKGQTEEGQVYIVGLTRELSGFMSYAAVNPNQKTAFSASKENLDKVAASCGLDVWTPPQTGDQSLCPVPNKPRFCTKIRYPGDLNAGIKVAGSVIQIILTMTLVVLQSIC